jgi:hypothetical protein
VESRAKNNAHDQADPYHRFGLLKLEVIGVKGCRSRNKYASPAQGETYVGVKVDLLEEVGSGEELFL